MSNYTKDSNQRDCTKISDSAAAEHLYETPELICYGDVRDVTLGPTPGFAESGCINDRQAGTPPSCP